MAKRYAIATLATAIVFSSVSPVLGGPAPLATVAGAAKEIASRALGKSKKAQRQSKKAVRKGGKAKRVAKRARDLAKENAQLIAALQASGTAGPKGDQGDPGDPGPPGENAPSMFAYSSHASISGVEVEYGEGVVGAVEGSEPGSYVVQFDRNMTGCVVNATPGFGDPRGGDGIAIQNNAIPKVDMRDTAEAPNADDVLVTFRRPDGMTDYGVPVATSFMVSAFC